MIDHWILGYSFLDKPLDVPPLHQAKMWHQVSLLASPQMSQQGPGDCEAQNVSGCLFRLDCYALVHKHSYGNSACVVDVPINMVIVHSYVKLPEGS